jgi:hypothetical protein
MPRMDATTSRPSRTIWMTFTPGPKMLRSVSTRAT